MVKEEYKYIGVEKGVCGGRPILKGTRLEPKQVLMYGVRDEIKAVFNLTDEQIDECIRYEQNKRE